MWTRMILLAACASALWGQAQLDPLDAYLQLNRTQRQSLGRNNQEHERWRRLKEDRVRQVRGEIFDETRRSPLDPTAMGFRYAEVEAICREIDEREVQLVKVNRDVLNEAQKVKLAALEEVMKLAPVANSAIMENLIHAAPISSLGYGNVFADFLLGRPAGWPAKQRTGACAPARAPTLGLVLPPPL